jgi:hypothetical protein
MSRSNYDKPFYVDVGTSIVAIRCASNHDVLVQYDHMWHPHTLNLAREVCDRMNKEVEVGKPSRNCDVGTVDEQSERFKAFCRAYPLCKRCPLKDAGSTYGDCTIYWSHMPYKSEETE